MIYCKKTKRMADMKKRFAAVLLILALVFCTASCRQENPAETVSTETENNTEETGEKEISDIKAGEITRLFKTAFADGQTLPEEFARLYPRLVRTTRAALAGFESEYGVHLSDEESGLVAVIFGAWLMQENDLHEKQIILLTGNDSEREAQIEQQLRELTLLPLNIKHMSVKAFLQTGAPRGATLIIAPYTMPLPLFSPPLIYTDLTLTTHQQEQIRKMLESA